MKHGILTIIATAVLFLLCSCVNDDTDFSDIINDGGVEDEIVPRDVQLDFTDLDEGPETIVTDVDNPDYNDYWENTKWSRTVNIRYDGANVTVDGYDGSDVSVTVNGAHVVVNSERNHINYVVSGSTSDGSLKIYSLNKFRVTLDGVNITNPAGAAINSQCGKSMYLHMNDGTSNMLADGDAYRDSGAEDMKGTVFSEGQIIVSGHGLLTISSNGRHALVSDDYIRVRPGARLLINSTSGHAVKGKDGVYIDGGVINATVSADGAKGINSDGFVNIAGGRTTLIASGGTAIDHVLSDTTSCAGVKADSIITVSAGALLVKCTGAGGKGINAHSDLVINAGSITIVTTGIKGDASPKGIKCDGTMTVAGGSTYCYSAHASPVSANRMVLAPGYLPTFIDCQSLFMVEY